MITIYGRSSSINVQKAVWTAAESRPTGSTPTEAYGDTAPVDMTNRFPAA